MNLEFKRTLAAQWLKILRSDPRRLFGADYKWIRRAAFDDCRAQPGYVGSRYKVGGLVFIAGNPGGQKQRPGQKIGKEDRKQYELLTNLRRTTPAKLVQAFDALNDDLAESMQSWNICAKYVQSIIKDLLNFHEIAFINLVKWRTVRETMPRPLLKKSWEAHTRDQVMLLGPSLVICLGKTVAGTFINRYYRDQAHVVTVPRTRKDLYITKGGKAAIARARRYIRARKLKPRWQR